MFLYMRLYQADDFITGQKFFTTTIRDTLLFRIFFQQSISRHDQSTDKFTLVADNSNLFDILIAPHLYFYCLRSYIFTIWGLIKVLDAFRKEQNVSFHTSGIPGTEKAVFSKWPRIFFRFIIITCSNCFTFDKNFSVTLVYFNFYSRHYFTDRTELKTYFRIETNCRRRFTQSVPIDNRNINGLKEFIHRIRQRSPCNRK